MSLRALLWLAVSTEAQAEDEKLSLPEQERAAKAVCEQYGWQIVEILQVPGHSRRYIDIHELAEDAAQRGIDAFKRLLKHFKNRDFDVLICRDADRFARTQSLHAYIVESVIDIGARIYSLADGWVDENNFRMFISMSGYRAAGAVDALVKARSVAMDAYAQRGIPTSSVVVESHKVVRDPNTGRIVGIELDESKRQLWLDLATLLLEGVAFNNLEEEMYNRFGHTNKRGEQWHRNKFIKLLYTPAFWGHSARHHRVKKAGEKQYRVGLWTFEPGHPIPEGVQIYYHTHEPVYKDELAQQVKAELARRSEVIHGRSRPQNTYRFRGLFICADCGYTMALWRKNKWHGLGCVSKYYQTGLRPSCDSRRLLPGKKAQQYIDRRLREMIESQRPDFFTLDGAQKLTSIEQEISEVHTEINKTERRAQRLIQQRADADDALQDLYLKEIQQVTRQLKSLKRRLAELQEQVQYSTNELQRQAFEEINAMSVDHFWQLEDRQINQFLLRLLGNRRFVVRNGEIIGITTAPRRSRRF
jgi:DNA invertase Pin-like site-specific DNA recombinase